MDPTGRRARIVRRTGIALGCVLAAYLVLVGVGLATGIRVPLTPWPQEKRSASGHGPAQDALMPRGGAHRPVPTRSSAAGIAPSGPAPTAGTSGSTPGAAPGAPAATSPAARTSPTTTARPTATSTMPGKGHGYGRTKSPRPKHT